MQNLQVIELKGQRVLTTRQLASAYETDVKVIQNNFSRNKERYVAGKHYIYMDRDELREVKTTYPQFEGELKRTSRAHFWTEKGALLHAKSLNTDKAWEVYEYLVDFYFRAKEQPPVVQETKPAPVENVEPTDRRSYYFCKPDNPMKVLEILLQVAREIGISVSSYPFKQYDSTLHNNVIGIGTNLTVEKACYELAYELSHVFIHYDGGNLIKSPLSKEYTMQAERAANMIIKMLNVKTRKA